MSSRNVDVVGMSGGISTFGVGVSGGTYRTDENCERIKLSKVLNDLGNVRWPLCQFFSRS